MKIGFKRLDHIMLCFPEGKEEEARAFYGGVLALPELTDLGYPLPNGAIWYQMGNIQLHIRAENSHELSQRHPAFEVHDLEAAREVLESNGVTVKYESKIPDRNRFSFRDPFGNRIEFIEMIA
ncbi:VOC family protein [Dyadobacter sp. CY323]|uniref:VOC family protein n=1 Tax=Dyadobacter sp. CY323 TaxID=2907302 RepID=UPI001F34E76F|nr:VOC family protein [Dyadobacter sp. CY323]MCE6987724.1 VOC family protein [Dyadobacter sp. CY323]